MSTFKVDCPVCSQELAIPVTFVGPDRLPDGGFTMRIVTDRLYVRRHFLTHPRGGGEPVAVAA